MFVNSGANRPEPSDASRVRRKLRWILISPDGDEVRSGLSFGAFNDERAFRRAREVASPPHGYTLRVFLDGRLIEPPAESIAT